MGENNQNPVKIFTPFPLCLFVHPTKKENCNVAKPGKYCIFGRAELSQNCVIESQGVQCTLLYKTCLVTTKYKTTTTWCFVIIRILNEDNRDWRISGILGYSAGRIKNAYST